MRETFGSELSGEVAGREMAGPVLDGRGFDFDAEGLGEQRVRKLQLEGGSKGLIAGLCRLRRHSPARLEYLRHKDGPGPLQIAAGRIKLSAALTGACRSSGDLILDAQANYLAFEPFFFKKDGFGFSSNAVIPVASVPKLFQELFGFVFLLVNVFEPEPLAVFRDYAAGLLSCIEI